MSTLTQTTETTAATNNLAPRTPTTNADQSTDRPTRRSTPTGAGVTFGRLVAAEQTKLRTVRSTVWTLTMLVAVSVGLTALIAFAVTPELAEGGAGAESVGSFLTWGLMFGQIAALVLGVLVASSEYSSGMIRTTLAAAPRRYTVLAAKATALGSLVLVLGTVTSFLSYVASRIFFAREGLEMTLSDPGVLRALFGGGLYLAVLALFGLGLGILVRHTAGAVTIGLALTFVLGNVVMLIPGSVGDWLTKLMPGNAGSGITMVDNFNPVALEPWVGFGVFAGQTALLLAVAALLFSRRDA